MKTLPALTKCARDGCTADTRGTFCGPECRRLASIGSVRAPKRSARAGVRMVKDLPDCREQEALSEYVRTELPAKMMPAWRYMQREGSSNARRMANIRKRREEREARAAKRRERLKKRR